MQEGNELFLDENSNQYNKKEIRSPLLLNIFNFPNYLPYPYPLFLFFALLLILLIIPSQINFSTLNQISISKDIIGAIFQCFSTIYVSWAVIYSYQTLVKNIQLFKELMEDVDKSQINLMVDNIYNSKLTYLIFSIITLTLTITAFFLLDHNFSHVSITGFYITFIFFAGITGFGGSTIFLISRFMTWYSNIELSFSVFQYPFSTFRFIGRMQFKFALITAFGYFLEALMTMLYWNFNYYTIFWLFIGIFVVIGFFLIPQRGFHKKIIKSKNEKLEAISQKIQIAFENTKEEPTPENIKKLKEMYEFSLLVSKLPSWPFETKILWGVLSTAILPIVIIFLQVLFTNLLGK